MWRVIVVDARAAELLAEMAFVGNNLTDRWIGSTTSGYAVIQPEP
jgi:hypothetical protein